MLPPLSRCRPAYILEVRQRSVSSEDGPSSSPSPPRTPRSPRSCPPWPAPLPNPAIALGHPGTSLLSLETGTPRRPTRRPRPPIRPAAAGLDCSEGCPKRHRHRPATAALPCGLSLGPSAPSAPAGPKRVRPGHSPCHRGHANGTLGCLGCLVFSGFSTGLLASLSLSAGAKLDEITSGVWHTTHTPASALAWTRRLADPDQSRPRPERERPAKTNTAQHALSSD
eukprot:1925943-Rhodomonas_salina.3